MKIEEAIKHLIIVNVLFFVLAELFSGGYFRETTALWYFQNPNYHWWQLGSHMFMHGGLMHLFFNMYALWMFGSPLVYLWGANRFFIYYFACGLGAALLHLMVVHYQFQTGVDALLLNGFKKQEILDILSKGQYLLSWEKYLTSDTLKMMIGAYQTSVVGASGAIYGILMGFAMAFPESKLMLLFFPIAIKAKYFILIILGLDLFSGVTGFSIFGGNIAHFAHIGGALIGFLMIYLSRKSQFNKKNYR